MNKRLLLFKEVLSRVRKGREINRIDTKEVRGFSGIRLNMDRERYDPI